MEASQLAPGSLSTQETLAEPQATPPPPVVPPFHHSPRPGMKWWYIGTAVVIVLVLLLSIGAVMLAQLGPHPVPQPTPTVQPTALPTGVPTTITTTPGADITPTPGPDIVLGPRACPAAVKDPASWRQFLPTSPLSFNPQEVTCGNLLDKPTLQAMVVATEVIGGGPTFRSVFVYDNITASQPHLLFTWRHLLLGEARISGYNTIMTVEVDLHSSLNQGKAYAALTPDLFREFDWNADKGTFVQAAFPGIFPDLTRYQAENDQAQVNKGKDPWKNDPKAVALRLGEQFFSWKRPLMTTLLSGGGTNDVYATVKLEATPFPGMKVGPSVTVTLSRLEGNPRNMWVVIAVEDGPGVLTSITPRSLLASPVRFEGTADAHERLIGHAYVLDHLFSVVGQATINAQPGLENATSPYSVLVSYETSFKTGPQEGVVEVALSSPVGAPYVLVKVLLDPQPQVAFGPISCPLAQQNPAFWQSRTGISPTTVTCGYLKGPANSTLQALLTVSPADGKPGQPLRVRPLADLACPTLRHGGSERQHQWLQHHHHSR